MRARWLGVFLLVGACHGKFGDAGDPKEPTPLAARPDYGPTVQATRPPPALSGGTLLVTGAVSGGRRFAVAADPERDQLHLVGLVDHTVRHVAFAAGAEPGRVVHEATTDRVHVVLRRAGAVATVDVATAEVKAVRAVCPAPRGVDVDPANGRLVVACAGGEVIALPFEPSGAASTLARLEPDLRDVAVLPDMTLITSFRSAKVQALPTASRVLLPSMGSRVPAVAWRMLRTGATAVVVHQVGNAPSQPVSTQPGGYAAQPPGAADSSGVTTESPGPGPCATSLVAATVSRISAGVAQPGPLLPQAVLPVDVAFEGGRTVVVAAGNAKTKSLQQLQAFVAGTATAGCVIGGGIADPEGQAVAVAFADARLVVQTREPAALHFYGDDTAVAPTKVVLATDSFEDTGYSIFHSNSGNHLACASCHPEGGDDGRVWTFDKIGPRRTQSLRGGVLATAPFHWDGDLRDLGTLADTVLSKRMSGPKLDGAQVAALARWLDAVPALPKPNIVTGSPTAGQVLFAKRCESCHAGATTTNNAAALVGTGAPFQVPSLRGVFYRAPYMHDGCADDLVARLRQPKCGGGDAHGKTSDLTSVQEQDLIAYLSTL